jgi:ParB-like chromosome segregation protein Spo0J
MSSIKSDKISIVDIEQVIPNPKNANRHSIEQIKRLEKLIKYQGFRNPLIISNRTGFLVVGHGRLEAAINLGMQKVPVIYQDFESEAQEYAYLISDNEIARWAELDKQAVIEDMAEFDLDLEMLAIEGFENFAAEEIDLPDLASGDKDPYQQKTFTLHDSQADTVDEAIKKVRDKYKEFYKNELNENSNGNAIAYICELFISEL